MTKYETEGERALDGRVRELERGGRPSKCDLVWAAAYAAEFNRLRADEPFSDDAVVARDAWRRADRAVLALQECDRPPIEGPDMKSAGLHTHRYADNPEEKRFVEMWARMGLDGSNLDYLLTPAENHDNGRLEPASDRDRQVAATIIQWLGSPVGQSFLRDLGYERKR